jgi:hypothetical protein
LFVGDFSGRPAMHRRTVHGTRRIFEECCCPVFTTADPALVEPYKDADEPVFVAVGMSIDLG